MTRLRKPLRKRAFQVALAVLALSLLAGLASGCKSSAEPPAPEFFGPEEKEVRSDARKLVFHNRSVEMAELEIFAPASPVEDCSAEAPHRLLCPSEYQKLIETQVYPRKKFEASYPEKLPLGCAHVWVRVHSKAMDTTEFREAIFLLAKQEEAKGLVMELQEGPAAQLKLDEGEATRRFPQPLRYCDPERPEKEQAPTATARPPEQVSAFVKAAEDVVAECCKERKCGRIERAELAVRRDGVVFETRLSPSRLRSEDQQRELEACIHEGVQAVRFPGFTQHQTTAQVTFRRRR